MYFNLDGSCCSANDVRLTMRGSLLSATDSPLGPDEYAIDLSLPMVPPSDRTAAAFGLGLGYRFSGGPGPMHIQIALRTHGLLLDATSASAYATVVALGIAY